MSVLMFAYNLLPYVEQAIDSVLGQRAPFDYEIVIGDDCSTDGTRQLLLEYHRRYPDRLRLVLPEQRLGGGGVPLFAEVFQVARGKYLAYCDCDDFWTAPDKLARQVAFLEGHPHCAICFHDCIVLWPDGRRDAMNYTPRAVSAISTIDDLCQDNFIASCSAVIRRTALPSLPAWYRDVRWGDWARYLLAARHGVIGYLAEEMGAYRLRPEGQWAGLSRVQQLESSLEFLQAMKTHLDGRYGCSITRGMHRIQIELARALWREGRHWEARRAFVRGCWTAWRVPAAQRTELRAVFAQLFRRPG